MKSILNRWVSSRWSLLVILACASAFAPLMMPPPGISTPEPIKKFLNDSLPNITPTNGGPISYAVKPAFPNLIFNSPLVLEMHPQLDTMFVASRDGLIEYFHHTPNVATKTTFLDLRPETAVVWDGGFLGMAFHPEFGDPSSANRNYFYTFYCGKGSNGEEGPIFPIAFTCENNPTYEGSYMILSRFEVQNGTLNVLPNSEQIMIKLRLYNSTHRGGGLTFGNDGLLYLALGEQARYTTSQNIYSNFEGGVIRIDVDQNASAGHAPIRKMGLQAGYSDEFSGVGYFVPNDNPWQDATGGTFEEFWTTGNRNPHRMTLDKLTGDLWSGEIGEGTHEEVNIIEAGKNYGWPRYEGNAQGTTFACGSNTMALGPGVYTPPVVDFLRTEMNCIIGGYVYRGSNIPSLNGNYICGGYSQNRIYAIQNNGGSYTKTEIANFAPGGLITFGQDHQGELYMGKEGNNVTLQKLVAVNAGPPAPQWLSQTGAFSDLTSLTPSPGVIPYDMIEPFWSDGASKSRWMAIPNDEDGNGMHDQADEKIIFSEEGEWEFPIGSVLIKHFELGTKRMETRFEVLGDDDVYYYLTYKWNAAGTDAELLAGSQDEVVSVDGVNQTWHYPSRSECLSCHQASVGSVLGPKTRHLNSSMTYPASGTSANQLVTLSHLGVLDQPILDADTATFLTMSSKTDLTASLDDRARSYLDVNCSHCHRPETGNRAAFDARLTTPLSLQNYINGSVINPLGITDARVVVPQDILKSILYQRLNMVGNNTAMPPLAKDLLDGPGVQLIGDWINGLSAVSELPLTTVGSASQLPGGCYELTPATGYQSGAAWYPEPISLDDDIVVNFSLSLGTDDLGADGASFVFQQEGPTVLGGGGGSGHAVGGISPSLGIGFDSFGQADDQIFVWQNGDMNNILAPRVCADAGCLNIEDGASHAVQIQWNSESEILDIYFDGFLRQSYTGDVINTIFGGNQWVYAGVGAATGGLYNQQSICNFNLQATFPPEPLNPNGDGLSATYYNNVNFTNQALTRVDQSIDFDWGLDSPDPSISNDTYSVRWQGGIVAPYTGTYTFYTTTDDGVRLWVDNQLIIDRWFDQGATEWTGTISLTAGQLIPLTMEFYENGGAASAKLAWSSILLPKSTVSQDNLFQVGSTFPVEWLAFEANQVESGVMLNWVTGLELNNESFTVERSHNQQDFQAIEQLSSQGNSDIPQFYQAFDPHPQSGSNFYRIKQTDLDGEYSYSDMLEVLYKATESRIQIYPNPVAPGGRLTVDLRLPSSGMVAVTLLDMTGRQIYHTRWEVKQGELTEQLPISDLPLGRYLLSLQGETWQEQKQILVH